MKGSDEVVIVRAMNTCGDDDSSVCRDEAGWESNDSVEGPAPVLVASIVTTCPAARLESLVHALPGHTVWLHGRADGRGLGSRCTKGVRLVLVVLLVATILLIGMLVMSLLGIEGLALAARVSAVWVIEACDARLRVVVAAPTSRSIILVCSFRSRTVVGRTCSHASVESSGACRHRVTSLVAVLCHAGCVAIPRFFKFVAHVKASTTCPPGWKGLHGGRVSVCLELWPLDIG